MGNDERSSAFIHQPIERSHERHMAISEPVLQFLHWSSDSDGHRLFWRMNQARGEPYAQESIKMKEVTMRRAIPLAVFILAALTALMAGADTHIYSYNLEKFQTEKVGRVQGGEDRVIYCNKDNQPTCWEIACNSCHSQPVDQNRYANDREMKHQRIHFPKSALRLAEGQRASFGTLVVTRSKGLLVVQDPRGRRFQLPPDALLVMGKDGKPTFITYTGTMEPQALR